MYFFIKINIYAYTEIQKDRISDMTEKSDVCLVVNTAASEEKEFLYLKLVGLC